MYINQINSISYTNPRLNNSFGQSKFKVGKTAKICSAAMLFAAAFGLHSSCNEQTSGDTFVNSQKVTYINADPKNKDIVISTLRTLQQRVKPEQDFLSDVKVTLVDDFDNLDTTDVFCKNVRKFDDLDNTKGISFYSDKTLPKQIIIQERAHRDDKIMNLLKKGKYSCDEQLKHSLVHEIGHQFDSYFGHDHNESFALRHDSLLKARFDNPNDNALKSPTKTEDIKTTLIYNEHNGLSDKETFKEAFLKDLKKIKQVKNTNSEKLPSNLQYFLKYIDLDSEINEEIVELNDFCRSEIYANLFSYAQGYDDGDKEAFTKAFANSYKEVKQDVQQHLR